MINLIDIEINGFQERVPLGSSLSQLIDLFDEAHPELVAELNGRFVHPNDYAATGVQPGDRVEFINAAFGG